jgi:hypothetical protein
MVLFISIAVLFGCQNAQHEKAVQTIDSLKVVTHTYNQLLMASPIDSLQFYQNKVNSQTLSIRTNLDTLVQQDIFSMAPEYFQLNGQISFLMQSEKALLEIAQQDIQRLTNLSNQIRTGSATDIGGHPMDDAGIETLVLQERNHTDSLVNACHQLHLSTTRILEKTRMIAPLIDKKIMAPIDNQ